MRIRTGFQTLAFGLLMAAPAMVYASGPKVPSTPPANTQPSTLDSRVHHAIANLPYYGIFDEITYRIDGDKVTLFGQVVDINLRRDAKDAVQHTEGVHSVDNQIEVFPLSRFDNDIRRRTSLAIYGYGPLTKYAQGVRPSIHILVKDGNVTLSGVVDSKFDHDVAYVRANGVAGAFSVTNNLQINP